MERPDSQLAITDVLPHSGRAVLLDAVLEHGPRHTICSADAIRAADFALADGTIPAWVGLEFLAQGVAAHAGLQARERGEVPSLGLFLGSRSVRLHADALTPGRALLVHVEHRLGLRGPSSFACWLRDAATDAILVEGHLTALAVKDASLLGDGGPA
jgi:predicted hotdog family 3-hydroxylacyl-ACP dehydratase